jgi:cell division protease FtsH
MIDADVGKIVDEGYETAKRILTEKVDDLHSLAQGLLEYETLTGADIRKVIAGEPLGRDDPDSDDNAPTGGKPSLTAVPKTSKPRGSGGLSPEPT